MSWSRIFSPPIQLSDGRTLVTLQDALTFVQSLRLEERFAPAWLSALENLLRAAERGDPFMEFARLAIVQALAGSQRAPQSGDERNKDLMTPAQQHQWRRKPLE
jgi:hypothetical protein